MAPHGALRSQSPQIGACLRTDVAAFEKAAALKSQSPQIGACLRTKGRILSGRGDCRVSIPSNRGLPSDCWSSYWEDTEDVVSIPSNRGLPSDTWGPPTQRPAPGLNPLKSGPAFGPWQGVLIKIQRTGSQSPQIGACLRTRRWERPIVLTLRSQSPQIGACLRTQVHERRPQDEVVVSIPSNRGLPSDST